jgi:uncharacterized protein DUF5979
MMERASMRSRLMASVGAVMLVVGVSAAMVGTASADKVQDTRADQVGGNPTTCDDVGFGSDLSIGADGNSPDSNGVLSGEVKTNAGPINTGQGEELDVTIIGSNVVVDAVVVKAGDGANVYTNPAVLPPALQPDQHYIAPWVGNGEQPALSHWFVCYHLGEEATTGSLSLLKTVVPLADGVQGVVIPATFDVHVSCTSGGEFDRSLVPDTPTVITGLPLGDTCTVVETSTLPDGSAVTYDPTDANTAGVKISEGDPVAVGIKNDFSQVAGIAVTKPVVIQPAFPG